MDFKSIDAKLKGSTVPVELEAKRWTLADGKMSISCLLGGNHAVLVVRRDDSLFRLSGLVTDAEEQFITGAKVAVKGIETTTDANGWFSLEIPPKKQEEKLLITIQSRVIKTSWNMLTPVGNKTNLVLVLENEAASHPSLRAAGFPFIEECILNPPADF